MVFDKRPCRAIANIQYDVTIFGTTLSLWGIREGKIPKKLHNHFHIFIGTVTVLTIHEGI